jgi:hypothetical protein
MLIPALESLEEKKIGRSMDKWIMTQFIRVY